jgi:hypothetical protein
MLWHFISQLTIQTLYNVADQLEMLSSRKDPLFFLRFLIDFNSNIVNYRICDCDTVTRFSLMTGYLSDSIILTVSDVSKRTREIRGGKTINNVTVKLGKVSSAHVCILWRGATV